LAINTQKRHDSALGASGTDVVGKIHNAEDTIEALTGPEAAIIYDKMRRTDTQVRKVLGAINNPIKSATWAFEPLSEEQVDVDAAVLADQILFKDINWTKFLNEALTMVGYGYSPFEVVHENKVSRDIGPYTGLAQLGYRRQATITEWNHNRITGALESVKQVSSTDIEIDVIIPAEFLLIFYNDQEGDGIGHPLLRNLYGPYKRKLLALELQYIGIERFAIPTPILKVPKNIKQSDAEYKDAVEVLQGFTSAQDSFITYPEGWELELHSNVFDPTKIGQVIKAEDENMASAVLASFLELGTGGNTGAYSLSTDLSDFFFAGLTYIADIIKDTINKTLIPQLMKLNYGEDFENFPKITYSGITDNAGLELMQVISGLTTSGIISRDEQLEDHVRKLFKLPVKIEGEIIDNQETDGGGDGDGPSDNSDSNIDSTDDNDSSNGEPTTQLSELGHYHEGTGPSIKRGQKHYHDKLDAKGNVVGRVTAEKDTPDHKHIIDANNMTGKKKEVKALSEPSNNPKKLIEQNSIAVADVIRRNLKNISDKYIADILKNYKDLPTNSKLRAPKNVKLGGLAIFKKELMGALTTAARESLDLAKADVPGHDNVKLSEDKEVLLKKYNMKSFKFNDFTSLPKSIQILIAYQAGLITEAQAGDVADTVAFQYGSSIPSTNDIDVLKADMKEAASDSINSGAKETAAANTSATVINETRNTFLFSAEVEQSIASYTFFNDDPKTDICQALNGTTYNTEDGDIIRYQPPLHHNCKSYIRANLKTSKNVPETTGLPPISESARESITFKDDK
jgi:hypothetical protein